MKPSNYIKICDAIVQLMDPLIEIVIHDLKTKKICYINGKLSKRKVGNPSLLDNKNLEKDIEEIIYPKINFDGKLVKSISIPLSEQWLMCINCDVSIFNQMQLLSNKFLNLEKNNQPKSLFKNDWQEKLHVAINDFLNNQNWTFESLNTNRKKDVIRHLYDIEAFGQKNAADYIAEILNMGRATIFKYLKEWRKNGY